MKIDIEDLMNKPKITKPITVRVELEDYKFALKYKISISKVTRAALKEIRNKVENK